MTFKFVKKFTEKDIDFFINSIYKNLDPSENYIFDLTELEWISNQELLVFTALVKYFDQKEIDLEIHFFKKGISINEIDPRVVNQLVQIWDVWHIWDVIAPNRLIKVFGFDGGSIDRLKKIHRIKSGNSEIYDRFGITPFVSLEKIENYNDSDIENILKSFYILTSATKEIIYNHNCQHPFVSDTLSDIVSKELYENFLDHFQSSFLNTEENWAFMSLSLKGRLNETKNDPTKIQRILSENFNDESLVDFKQFFYDENKNNFKNVAYLQFSFLDFGKGIPNTLREVYLTQNADTVANDSDILRYAFKHNSSRHPILTKANKFDETIPRGLFDIVSIVHRYEGLIVVRSNYGKIFYDFTGGKSIDESFSTFGNEQLFFPGTLISIYLPALPLNKNPDSSAIKPEIIKEKYASNAKVYINIYHIINRIKSAKKDIYTVLISELMDKIHNKGTARTIYFSFKGYETDKRLARKVIFYLLTDYEINLNNNVIIIHPPNREILEEINNEVLSLSSVIKNYVVHPLPFVYYTPEENELHLQWVGVYDENDRIKLNDLLFEDFSLARSDFIEPSNITGHVNFFDVYGNLKSLFPQRTELLAYYSNEYEISEANIVKELLVKNNCIVDSNKEYLYLCHGNYYQFEFIDLINLLNNIDDCNLISEILYRRISSSFADFDAFLFIGITTSSHKILLSLIKQNLINERQVLLFDNYHSFEEDDKFLKIQHGKKFILVCDVVATGFLTLKLEGELIKKGSMLAGVSVIVDTIDKTFESSGLVLEKQEFQFISLYTRRINKFRRNVPTIKPFLLEKKVIRINPFTNLPIDLSIKETNNMRILLSNEQFLEYVTDDQIKIGYLNFNNVIHPYFFDTNSIIKNIDKELLIKIFKRIKINANELKIFYPKDSGIMHLNIEMLKNNVFKDQSIELFELERFNTTEGWRFPHTTDHFNKITDNKTAFILDDGSCTGDSLIQMVDELALFNVKEIILLCIIGRVNDQKREFFSRMTHIKAKQDNPIRISVYFGSHWHIPTYYLEDNPVSEERKWLRDVIELQNTPESIKSIARRILAALTPTSIESFKAYKYLPTIKGSNDRIAKREIIKVREQIGRVIGYRFYKESFSYFNQIISKYEGGDKTDRNKEMELLCCVFLYEPYLYDKVKKIMPDIVDKIEEFIDALIFGNPKKNNKKINIGKELTYTWDRKDIIHLFFIVFRGDELIRKLNDTGTFKKLIDFVGDTDSTINYILYKILAYFPVAKKSLVIGDTGHILHLLDISLQGKLFPEHFVKEVKIFRSFVSTLPSSEGYIPGLAIINENYRKLTDAILHKESITVQYDIMMVDLEVLENSFGVSTRENFIDTWLKVSDFIAPILSFAKAFPGFFLDRINSIEGTTGTSLRNIHGQLNDLINHINQDSDFERIRTLVNRFKHKFLETDSDMFKIFNKVSTQRIFEKLEKLLISKDLINDFTIDYGYVENTSLDVPEFLLIDVIFNEIIINLRHRDKNEKVSLTFTQNKEYLFISISNEIAKEIKHGGGNGLALLDRIKQFPANYLKYKNNHKEKGQKFIQELRIKKI